MLHRIPFWALVPASFVLGTLIGVGFSYLLRSEQSLLDTYGVLITAIATVAVAWFTLSLRDVSAKQHELQATQHFVTHRPHLAIRNVRAVNVAGGAPIEIAFEVINNGTSEAEIIASWFEAHFIQENRTYDRVPPPVVGTPARIFIGHVTLQVNAVWRQETFKAGDVWTDAHLNPNRPANQGFFWGGKILYRDSNGQSRRLGVFRRFDPNTNRFRALVKPDEDYEYDD